MNDLKKNNSKQNRLKIKLAGLEHLKTYMTLVLSAIPQMFYNDLLKGKTSQK